MNDRVREYKILAIDPGVTTGFCYIEKWADQANTFDVVMSGVIPWKLRFQMTHQLIYTYTPLIVCEKFVLYKKKAKDQIGNDFPSAQVTGIVGAWAYRYDCELYIQPAVLMDRVEILPEHAASLHKSEHGRDAYKHGRYLLEKLIAQAKREQGRKA